MDSVGVRELRQNLSKHLERVKGGEVLTVTDRGREVAYLSPVAGRALSDGDLRLLARGARLGRGRFSEIPRRGAPPPGPSSAELLAEQREERL